MPDSAGASFVLLGTFGPLLAAVTIVSRSGGLAGAGRLLRPLFRWRVNVIWWALALVGPLAIRIFVIWIHVLKGNQVPDLSDPARWLAIPSTFLLVVLLGGPLGEEVGWRGLALPALQARIGALRASLVIGVGSAGWYLPLFFIAFMPHSQLPFAVFLIRTTALSVVCTWLYNRSRGSLLIVVLFHASINTWPNSLYILNTEHTLGPYLGSTVMYAGAAVILILLNAVSRRQRAIEGLDSPAVDHPQAA